MDWKEQELPNDGLSRINRRKMTPNNQFKLHLLAIST